MNLDVRRKSRTYDIVSTDITNQCNCRCKFCFNDWDCFEHALMTPECFDKATGILPYCHENGYYFSCLLEPTIHPRMFEYLSRIPPTLRSKVFFTSNLVRRMTDEEVLALCESGINHVNVSLETYDEELYTELAGVKKSSFYDNLDRLGRIASEKGFGIQLITMILRSNAAELPELITRASETLHPIVHEVRTPYIYDSEGNVMDVLEPELLTREELDVLSSEIEGLGFDNVVLDTSISLETYEQAKAGSEPGGNEQEESPYSGSFVARIEANGEGHVKVGKDHFKKEFHLETMESPLFFFSECLMEMQAKEASLYRASKEREESEPGQAPAFGSDAPCIGDVLQGAFLYDGRFLHLMLSLEDPEPGSDACIVASWEDGSSGEARDERFHIGRLIPIAVADHEGLGNALTIIDTHLLPHDAHIALSLVRGPGSDGPQGKLGILHQGFRTIERFDAPQPEYGVPADDAAPRRPLWFRAARKAYRTVKRK